MELTLAQCASLATQFVQGRTDVTLSQISQFANLAVEHIRTRLRTRAEEGLAISSTTSGENRVSLPSDFGFPISLSNLSVSDDKRVLVQKEADTFDSRATFIGCPREYALFSSWAELWPSPDSAYSLQLRYGKKVATITASTSTPDLDSRYHMAWVFKTAEYVAASRGDLENEAINRARFLSDMGSQPEDRALAQRNKLSMRVNLLRGVPK